MLFYITHAPTGWPTAWQLCYRAKDGCWWTPQDYPITNDDLRSLQRDILRILGGPPAARSWARKTQTDSRENPLRMEHEQDWVSLTRGADPAAWSHEAVGLNKHEAAQVRDFLDYWLLHWNGPEEFPQIGPTEEESPDGN